jgi:molybdenum cofactor cytidylyltransferase
VINRSLNDSRKSNLCVVILAAGSSSRLGVPKQLLPWKGKTLLNHTIDQFRKLGIEPYVVLGAYSESILPTIDVSDSHVLFNDRHHEGLATSIHLAIQKIGKSSDFILFTLSDLPLITSEFYQRLIALKGDKIAATIVQGKRMVPAIFPKTTFKLLEAFSGDKGARELLNGPGSNIVTLEADDYWIDVDTREDYRNLLKMHGTVE